MFSGILCLLGDQTPRDVDQAQSLFRAAASQTESDWAKERAGNIVRLLTAQQIENTGDLARDVINGLGKPASAAGQSNNGGISRALENQTDKETEIQQL